MDEQFERDIKKLIESGNETTAANRLVEYLKSQYKDEKAWEYLYKYTDDEAMLSSCITGLQRINPKNPFLLSLINNKRLQVKRISEIRKKGTKKAELEKSLRRTIKVTEEFCLEFIHIPKGEFIMGSTHNDELADDDEFPQHKVFLDSYWIGKYPITEFQFYMYMILNQTTPPDIGRIARPVGYITFDLATEFCAWLFLMTGIHFRLPTEAEWEKAARGTDGRIFPWGNQEPNSYLCNYDLYFVSAVNIGNYSPQGDSPYGCVDMSGNVWEWCNSVYMPYPYDKGDGRESTYYGNRGGFDRRVLRGGSGADSVKNIRCAARGWATAYNQKETFGFRICASELPE